jgi:hypothetical protein
LTAAFPKTEETERKSWFDPGAHMAADLDAIETRLHLISGPRVAVTMMPTSGVGAR